jgi:mitochondrial import inner membrane translocase subunit TIM8
MSSTDFNIDQSDLEKLNDKDKTELRQFFANEEHRARIQSRKHASLPLFPVFPLSRRPS